MPNKPLKPPSIEKNPEVPMPETTSLKETIKNG
jgi:hypothetical protein